MKPTMNDPVDEASVRRELIRLGDGLFPDSNWMDGFELIDEAALPAPAKTLLAHGGHMTATLRKFYSSAIQLEVVTDRSTGDEYKRRILLAIGGPRRIVELGVVRIDLRFIPAPAKPVIMTKATPLGDVLANHNVLTRVTPRAFLRFRGGGTVVECFERGSDIEAFGRLGTIHCNGDEAIELLEVVAP